MSGSKLARYQSLLPDRADPFKLPEDARQLWELFLRDKAELTRKNYELDLRCFARFAGCETIYEAIDKLVACSAPEANATVLAYVGHLRETRFFREGDDPQTAPPVQVGYAPATIKRRIYALRAVADLARMCGVITWDVQIKLRKPENVRDTTGCGPAGYGAILEVLAEAVDDGREPSGPSETPSDRQRRRRSLEIALRDLILVRLLHDSGLRRAETTRIEWPDGVILSEDDPKVLVLRKGRTRMKWKPISRPCATTISEYVALRKVKRGYLLASTHPSNRGGKLSVATVNRRIRHWSDIAQAPVTPHGLRHTATTTALDHYEGDYREVMQWSGHEDPGSLRVYDDARRRTDRDITDLLADPTGARPHED